MSSRSRDSQFAKRCFQFLGILKQALRLAVIVIAADEYRGSGFPSVRFEMQAEAREIVDVYVEQPALEVEAIEA